MNPTITPDDTGPQETIVIPRQDATEEDYEKYYRQTSEMRKAAIDHLETFVVTPDDILIDAFSEGWIHAIISMRNSGYPS